MSTLTVCRDILERRAPPQKLLIDLWAPRERPAAFAVEALVCLLREAAAPDRDGDVARVKLAWWQDELRNMAQGRARHPVTQAMERAGVAERLPAELAAALIAPSEWELDPPAVTEVSDWLQTGAGEGLLLAAESAGRADESALVRVGAFRRALYRLRTVTAFAAAGRPVLPLRSQARFALGPADPAAGRGVLAEVVQALCPSDFDGRSSLEGTRALASYEMERAQTLGRVPDGAGAASRVRRVFHAWRTIRRSRLSAEQRGS